MSNPHSSSEYFPALDGLRAIAALAVLTAHAGVPGFGGGGRGVDVFFVLSGFLITGLIREGLQKRAFSYSRFIWNRAVRLVPALLLVVVAYVALAPLLRPVDQVAREAFLALTYTTNYSLAADFRVSGLSHTWSLAVEEHFYLLWPLALVALIGSRFSAAIILGVIWMFLTLIRLSAAFYEPWEAIYHPTHFHSSGLVLGAALSFARPSRWINNLIWPASLLLVLLLTVLKPETGLDKVTWATTLAELASAPVIIALTRRGPLSRALSAEPLRQLGLISYGIYLWHWPITVAVPVAPLWLRFPVIAISTICIAYLSFWLVERPVRARWRASALLAPDQATLPATGSTLP